MKKFFAILALAAMTLTVSAQDAALKSYNGKMFACQYPADLEAQDQITDESFYAEHPEDECMGNFSVTIMSQDLTPQVMKEWIDYMKKVRNTVPGRLSDKARLKANRSLSALSVKRNTTRVKW